MALDKRRRGAPYTPETWREIHACFSSKCNISITTAYWNQGINKKHENQITRYAKGLIKWSQLTEGAQHRYRQQAKAWRDVKNGTPIKEIAPALAKELDVFYNIGNKK